MQLTYKTKLFVVLFLSGMLGVLSTLLIDIPAVIALLPESQRPEVLPLPIPVIKLVGLVQPSLLLALAAFTGVALAPKVGLHAPATEALLSNSEVGPALKPQVVPGLIGGTLGGLSILGMFALFKPFLSPQVAERIVKFGLITPIPMRLLYGGITEELLLRWGFMTLLVWISWRLLQKKNGLPWASIVLCAILVSSLVFAIGHLPIAYLLIPEPGAALTAYVVLANSIFGLVAGILYWRKGLESAIIAHMFCHVWLIAASLTGVS